MFNDLQTRNARLGRIDYTRAAIKSVRIVGDYVVGIVLLTAMLYVLALISYLVANI